MLAYNDALEATVSLPKEPKVRVGTFASLALSYFNSAKFKSHSPETQRSQRGIINGLVAAHGDKSVAILRITSRRWWMPKRRRHRRRAIC